jgi:hypothetical protein
VDRLDIGRVDRDGGDTSRRPKNPLRKTGRAWIPASLSRRARQKAIGEQMSHLDRTASMHAERKVSKFRKTSHRSLAYKCERDLLPVEAWRYAEKEADIDEGIAGVPDVDMDATDVKMDASEGLDSHWRVFVNLGTSTTKREVKRCQTALRAMIAHGRWIFKNCPDVVIADWWNEVTLIAFINSLPQTAQRLRDYAHRLLAFVNRAEAIREFHAIDADLDQELSSIVPSTETNSVAWTLNDINNALQAAYDLGQDLNYRQKPGEEHLFSWCDETQQIFDGMISWLRDVPSYANQAINNLLNGVKTRARRIWVLLRTRHAEVQEWSL